LFQPDDASSVSIFHEMVSLSLVNLLFNFFFFFFCSFLFFPVLSRLLAVLALCARFCFSGRRTLKFGQDASVFVSNNVWPRFPLLSESTGSEAIPTNCLRPSRGPTTTAVCCPRRLFLQLSEFPSCFEPCPTLFRKPAIRSPSRASRRNLRVALCQLAFLLFKSTWLQQGSAD
jgi:hypothetical protein